MNTNINELFSIEDECIVITGGCGQLGKQYTSILLDYGAKVAVLDINKDVKFFNKKQKEYKNSLAYIETDITSKKSIEESLKTIVNTLGKPTALINNAAIGYNCFTTDVDMAIAKKVFQINYELEKLQS